MFNPKSLTTLLLEQVCERPQDVAIKHDDDVLSFEQLGEASHKIAHVLRVRQTQHHVVGIYLNPSSHLIISVWGTLLAGKGYMPLSTEYPPARVKYMIEDSGVNMIITSRSLRQEFEAFELNGIELIIIDDLLEEHIADLPSDIIDYSTDEANAYVIYTSGSTGQPKGVLIGSKAISNQLQWLKQDQEINEHKVILQKTPISFDAAQWEILASACGVKIIIGSEDIYRDPESIIELIQEEEITTLQCVPTLLQALCQFNEFSNCDSLKQVFSGGEALSVKLAKRFYEILPDSQLVNLYGPTECTINASSFTVAKDADFGTQHMISIGLPVANTKFYILDGDLKPVPVGKTGELFIGGIQLANEYINNKEATASKFINNPEFEPEYPKLYRTGDLVQWNENGSVQFKGRNDNQVKLRGYRVELDEIRVAIESHHWVKNAVVLVQKAKRTNADYLTAFVELDAAEAALMDQGNHGSHHQSKSNKLQLKTQLSNLGMRQVDFDKDITVKLSAVSDSEARTLAFARKTYRFYQGEEVTEASLKHLFRYNHKRTITEELEALNEEKLSSILKYFSPFGSEERLLPKYCYASPGALYATQMYLEIYNIEGISDGIYYYHPAEHQLVFIHRHSGADKAKVKVHFMGKKSAIEPVYKNNIQEVLEMEVGHMLGVFEKVLPSYGLFVDEGRFTPEVKQRLDCAEEDYYLGTFELTPFTAIPANDGVEVYLQVNNKSVGSLRKGTYEVKRSGFRKISDEVIERKEVIAINQDVFDRSSVGISMVSHGIADWKKFIVLGKKLQHLQMNDLSFGFMSSGYSSKSGHDLPAAIKLKSILSKAGKPISECYFCIGGLISADQKLAQGMAEDVVHMKGPAEMLRDDLAQRLPHYMIPNHISIIDDMPYTPSQKIDVKAIEKLGQELINNNKRAFVTPRTRAEKWLAKQWSELLMMEDLSVTDDFFEMGGNSLLAVSLINKINKKYGCKLPMQLVLENTSIEKLALKINERSERKVSRAVNLQAAGDGQMIFGWSGLGGYVMNLKLLAEKLGKERPFVGIQSLGLNENEKPAESIYEMAISDLVEIKGKQAQGPYTLLGFSFGARIAFETCFQLEQQGQKVDNLILIAPGAPKVWADNEKHDGGGEGFNNLTFVTILFSVFAGSLKDKRLESCLKQTKDEDSFIHFIHGNFAGLSVDLIHRIVNIVKLNYDFRYNFSELMERQIKAPITIIKAKGDDYSFIESVQGFSSNDPSVYELEGNHYEILKQPHIDELASRLKKILGLRKNDFVTFN